MGHHNHSNKRHTARIRIFFILTAILFVTACQSISHFRVSPYSDGTWYEIYENRGGDIQRVLVSRPEKKRGLNIQNNTIRKTLITLRERKVNETNEYIILDPTDLSMAGARKLMTINPGSSLMVKTTEEGLQLNIIVDFEKKFFWGKELSQNLQL